MAGSPFLKKAIQQNEKQVADNNRKVTDLTKSIADYKRKLEQSCAAIGIQGVSFRDELQRLPLELPAIFDQVAHAICSDDVAKALAYHAALQEYLHNCEVPAVSATAMAAASSSSSKKDKKKRGAKAAAADAASLEPLDAAFETVAAPFAFFTAIEELRAASDRVAAAPSLLDFEAEAAEIDWDFSIDESGSGDAATIDWGIEAVAADDGAVAGGDVADLDAPVEIDWDITSTDVVDMEEPAFSLGNGDDAATAVDSIVSLAIDGDAAEPTRVGLLEESEFRTRVQNDLLELRAFLHQRSVELQSSNSVAFANQFQGTCGTSVLVVLLTRVWLAHSVSLCIVHRQWLSSNRASRRSRCTSVQSTVRSAS